MKSQEEIKWRYTAGRKSRRTITRSGRKLKIGYERKLKRRWPTKTVVNMTKQELPL